MFVLLFSLLLYSFPLCFVPYPLFCSSYPPCFSLCLLLLYFCLPNSSYTLCSVSTFLLLFSSHPPFALFPPSYSVLCTLLFLLPLFLPLLFFNSLSILSSTFCSVPSTLFVVPRRSPAPPRPPKAPAHLLYTHS